MIPEPCIPYSNQVIMIFSQQPQILFLLENKQTNKKQYRSDIFSILQSTENISSVPTENISSVLHNYPTAHTFSLHTHTPNLSSYFSFPHTRALLPTMPKSHQYVTNFLHRK